MKKKILAAMLAMVMSVSLVACAEKSDNNSGKDSDTKVESSKEKNKKDKNDKNDKDEADVEDDTEKSDESDADESIIEEIVEEITDPYAEMVNSTITLGTFEDRKLTWIVLDVDETGKAFVIIENRLDEKHVFSMRGATWESSEIRAWLNDDFYNGAFTDEEKETIYTTTVVTPGNDELEIAGIADTEDNVFLLSADEVNTYLTDEAGNIHYTCLDEWNGSAMWWLRTPGVDHKYAVYCSSRFGINYDCFMNTGKYICPAMYVDLSKIL